jgi:acetyltransferase
MTNQEVEAMLTETKANSLLEGYRGEAPRDVPALVETIRRVAALVSDFDDIKEMDINPIFVRRRRFRSGYQDLAQK